VFYAQWTLAVSSSCESKIKVAECESDILDIRLWLIIETFVFYVYIFATTFFINYHSI